MVVVADFDWLFLPAQFGVIQPAQYNWLMESNLCGISRAPGPYGKFAFHTLSFRPHHVESPNVRQAELQRRVLILTIMLHIFVSQNLRAGLSCLSEAGGRRPWHRSLGEVATG